MRTTQKLIALTLTLILCLPVFAVPAGAEADGAVSVGDYVTFGRYEQDNDLDNGAEPIEWYVLEGQDGKALLISEYGLDAMPYNEEKVDVTWETCTLRGWLNGEFMATAFTDDEKSAILLTNVDNSDGQGFGKWSDTTGGNDTQDQVFLLSYAEADGYFGVPYLQAHARSRKAPTAYALAKGAYTDPNYTAASFDAAGWWWLRSPGSSQQSAATVFCDGSVSGFGVDNDAGCVCPALWVDLSAGII